MAEDVFRFLPGDKLVFRFSWPGPDFEDCILVSDDGGNSVTIKFQVYGEGEWYTSKIKRSRVSWRKDTPVSIRHQRWKDGGNGK